MSKFESIYLLDLNKNLVFFLLKYFISIFFGNFTYPWVHMTVVAVFHWKFGIWMVNIKFYSKLFELFFSQAVSNSISIKCHVTSFLYVSVTSPRTSKSYIADQIRFERNINSQKRVYISKATIYLNFINSLLKITSAC